MKNLFFISLYLLLSSTCLSQEQTIEPIKQGFKLSKSKILGIWINQKKDGFMILDIQSLKKVILYYYADHDSGIVENRGKMEPLFYKLHGIVSIRYETGFSIRANKYGFDFVLKNDTLYTLDETGLSEKFIKVQIDK
jgi:hypothetical protein